jgi:hypothetical protein
MLVRSSRAAGSHCTVRQNKKKHQKTTILFRIYSPFCVPAKVTKLIGLKCPPFLSPTNLIIFACTQNGEYSSVSVSPKNLI